MHDASAQMCLHHSCARGQKIREQDGQFEESVERMELSEDGLSDEDKQAIQEARQGRAAARLHVETITRLASLSS